MDQISLLETSPDAARPRSKYLIDGPTVISFSGGRTSAYMLFRILQEHGMKLPEQAHVLFANTGKEREETLDFVRECGARWNVNIRWIEWMYEKPRYREVSYDSASRKGEPFDALIAWKKMLPNPMQRLCTQHLKIDAMRRFVRHELGFRTPYTSVIGIRHDEPRRWRILGQDKRNSKEFKVGPLVDDHVTEDDVMRFWQDQSFDLHLTQGEGNCDLCFMKSTATRDRLVRLRPDLAEWWAHHENKERGSRGLWRISGASFSALLDRQRRQLPLFQDLHESEPDCACTD